MGLSCGEVLLNPHFAAYGSCIGGPGLECGSQYLESFVKLEIFVVIFVFLFQYFIFFLLSFTLLYRSLYCPLSLSAVLLWWCYGFIELVCGRNLWIKVISLSLRFSQDVKLPFTFVCFSERDSKRHMFQMHTRWLPGSDASSRAGGT